jgi:anti-sigma regulatory factor (Ser/Thr protein kinase)
MSGSPCLPLPAAPVSARAADPAALPATGPAAGVKLAFAPDLRRVGQMRRISEAHLRLWGLESCIETALLLVSELVTNAVVHGRGEVEFVLSYRDGVVCIEVRDASPARPRARRPAPDEEHGRGLLLVTALAGAWGTSQDGTCTWCTIRRP